MSSNLKIAISGKSGCGNSTVSRIVAESLGLKLVNYTFHSIAEEESMTFEEVCRLAENDSRYDLRVDKRQVELAAEGNCVLGSRLAIWLLEDADLKVYLEASLRERAERIRKREGGDMDGVLTKTAERDRRDRARYIRLYNIDIDRYQFADLIINTEPINQYETADIVIERVRALMPG